MLSSALSVDPEYFLQFTQIESPVAVVGTQKLLSEITLPHHLVGLYTN
jgi:hypothetical protein